ncbi:hypothetical protein [Frigoriglobus tundricola]|uniref:DUF155 domain-containing protein n=1 Tax=Frigoriglobus tundricola TaxID=2774151 RepID=A0A6M5YTI1_9BACT|nr:hypothetical protein [Frigoriglobus tundricola]QJW97328.1 hypothetical protein FTUN_4898 [Frigoriglobus tundricola]
MSGSEPPSGVVVRRLRFASHSVATGRICRTFKHPRLCLAVDEPAAPADFNHKPAAHEPADELLVVFVPARAAAEWKAIGDGWFPAPAPDTPTADVAWRGGRVQWRPGRAVVHLTGAAQDEVLSALAEFAFYEAELRRLETELDTREATAADDVGRAHTIRRRDKAHWPRFTAAIEAFARMRLTFARLAPRLSEDPSAPGPLGHRLASRLFLHARAGARAEALDARLEVCEDLYEGANDRVADVKGWHDGFVMELIIVLLLLLEVVLLCGDLLVRGMGE